MLQKAMGILLARENLLIGLLGCDEKVVRADTYTMMKSKLLMS